MNLMPKTIKLKLVYGISFVIALILLINMFMSFNEYRQIDEQLTAELSDVLQVSKVSLLQPLWDYDGKTMEAIVDSIMLTDYIAKVVISDAEHRFMFGKEKENLMVMADKLIVGEEAFIYEHKVIGYIEIQVSTYFTGKRVLQEMITNLIIILVELFITLILLIVISDRITKPLSQMELIATRIAEGSLDNLFDIKNNDEIGELGTALNKMQTRLRDNELFINEKISELEDRNMTITEMNTQLEMMVLEVSRNYKSTVIALANSIEANDAYTRGHCERVSHYAVSIAKKMNISKEELEILEYAAALHDIGKIAIPYSILNKPDTLTYEEFDTIKSHSKVGYDIIKDIDFLKSSAIIVLEHHEKEDGTGYPNGLISEQISQSAKILCVADAYDAMTSSRPYRREPMPVNVAVQQLMEFSGKQFNKEIVDIFIETLREAGEYHEA